MATPSIEDRLAIGDVFVRYTTGLDECDIETVVGCFTEDCRLVSPIHGEFRGHQGIRDFAAPNVRITAEGGKFRHFISNLVIDVNGDRAKAYCYLLDFLTLDGRTQLLSPGVYDCDLVKRDGRWLLKQRLVSMDFKFSLPGPKTSRKAGPKARKRKAARSSAKAKAGAARKRASARASAPRNRKSAGPRRETGAKGAVRKTRAKRRPR